MRKSNSNKNFKPSVRFSMQTKEMITFYTFISPWLIGFLCLVAGPMFFSLYAAFSDWNGITAPIFTGFANLKQMFFIDDKFWISLFNTFYFALFSVPINLSIALLLAVLLNKKHRGSTFFRSMFYLPSVVASVGVYIVWRNLYNSDSGLINYALSLVGVKGPGWLTTPAFAMPSIILMTITFCGSSILIFLAGLQDIPTSMYEAAKIDGATSFKMFVNITLPLLSPIIFYNLIMGIIGGLQVFTQPFILTSGGPLNATYVYGIHLYNNAFKYGKFGYSSTLAWFLFIIVLLLSSVVFKTSKLWVHSESND